MFEVLEPYTQRVVPGRLYENVSFPGVFDLSDTVVVNEVTDISELMNIMVDGDYVNLAVDYQLCTVIETGDTVTTSGAVFIRPEAEHLTTNFSVYRLFEDSSELKGEWSFEFEGQRYAAVGFFSENHS